MKTILIIIIMALGISCEKASTENNNYSELQEEIIFNDTKEFQILSGACGNIKYVGRIGSDFTSAFDSLMDITILPDSGCPDNPCKDYHIHKELFDIKFDYDNRIFTAIVFKDTNDYQYLRAKNDVLDNKGNHYRILWCPD